jgi:hypothetical protein
MWFVSSGDSTTKNVEEKQPLAGGCFFFGTLLVHFFEFDRCFNWLSSIGSAAF